MMARTNPKDATSEKRHDKQRPPEVPNSPYTAIPDSVLDSEAYKHLSDGAIRLLLELVRHHDGFNNGMLHAAYTALRERGLGSQSKNQRAFVELIRAGLMVQTKRGGLNLGPNCYALTWLPPNSHDRYGQKKSMPTLPSPYPMNKYLQVQTPQKEVRLKGAARQARSKRMSMEICGDISETTLQENTQASSTGNTVLLSPSGTVEHRELAEIVPPEDTDHPAQEYSLSGPAIQHCTAQQYGEKSSVADKRRSIRSEEPKQIPPGKAMKSKSGKRPISPNAMPVIDPNQLELTFGFTDAVQSQNHALGTR